MGASGTTVAGTGAQIFISYRRDDAAGYARAVNDELGRCFGAERVFIDVDDITAGQPFSEIIQRSVGDSAVLLALIGKRWRGEREGAAPRIFEAGDFVRQEVAAGLAKRPARHSRAARRRGDAGAGATCRPTSARSPGATPSRSTTRASRPTWRGWCARCAGRSANPRRRRRRRAPASRPGWWIAAVVMAVVAIVALWQWQRSPAPMPSSRSEQAPVPAPRAPVNGEWRADVTYDWDNARFSERFTFAGEGDALHGSASFLGVARGVLEGRVDAGGLAFVTRTSETSGAGDAGAAVVHRYRGRLAGDELRFVMQTEGGSSAHVPVEFVARRISAAAPQASR